MDSPVHCFGSWAPPPHVHLVFIIIHGIESMYYCEHKPKIKTGEAWDRGYQFPTKTYIPPVSSLSTHLLSPCLVPSLSLAGRLTPPPPPPPPPPELLLTLMLVLLVVLLTPSCSFFLLEPELHSVHVHI